MYVADIDDIEELRFLESNLVQAQAIRPCEQNAWDLEDIRERIAELEA